MKKNKFEDFTITAGCTVMSLAGMQSCMCACWKGNFTLYQVITLQLPIIEDVPFE